MVENNNLRADLFVMDLFQLGDLSGLHDKIEFFQNNLALPLQISPNAHLTTEEKFPPINMVKSNTEIYLA